MAVTPTGVVTLECWLEDALEEGWVVAYRIVPQSGQPVIAEARVYPGKPDSSPRPGEWSGEPDAVPEWGLTARRLKKLRPDTSTRSIPDIFGNLKTQWGEDAFYGERSVVARHGLSPTAPEPRRRVGRPPAHDLSFYAKLARDYARLVNGGSRRPIPELAKAWESPEATVRNWKRMALKKGLMTESPPGVPGGQLTRLAIEVLDAAGEEVE